MVEEKTRRKGKEINECLRRNEKVIRWDIQDSIR